jgi:hypothetical protein
MAIFTDLNMSEEKRNIKLVFITGLSLGLVLGGAFFFFSQNTQIIKYPIEVSQKTIEKIVQRVMGDMNAKKDSLDKVNKRIVKKIDNKNSLTGADSAILNKDTSSLKMDTALLTDELIEVKKDQLLAIKNIDALNLDIINRSSKDSLLQAISGVQLDNKSFKKTTVSLEFWKSPINYRGYKFVKNKLIIFGLEPQDESLAMVISDNIYYLKTINGVLRLTFTEEFKSSEKVTNPSILSLFE